MTALERAQEVLEINGLEHVFTCHKMKAASRLTELPIGLKWKDRINDAYLMYWWGLPKNMNTNVVRLKCLAETRAIFEEEFSDFGCKLGLCNETVKAGTKQYAATAWALEHPLGVTVHFWENAKKVRFFRINRTKNNTYTRKPCFIKALIAQGVLDSLTGNVLIEQYKRAKYARKA